SLINESRPRVGIRAAQNQRTSAYLGQVTQVTRPANATRIRQRISSRNVDLSASGLQCDTTIGSEIEGGGRLQRATIKSELIGHWRIWCSAQVRITRDAQAPGVDRGDPRIGVRAGQDQRAWAFFDNSTGAVDRRIDRGSHIVEGGIDYRRINQI